jgi:hypothetical protein
MAGQPLASRLGATALVFALILAPARPALGEDPQATLTVVADETASVDVTLPELTIMHPPPHQRPTGITIDGAGRVTGIVLRSADGTAELSIMRWNRCREAGCSKSNEPSYSLAGGQMGVDGSRITHTLPAGRYRAYIVTDGAPVTVTLALPHGAASAQLTATGPASATVDTPAMTALPGGLHQAGGSSHTFGPGSGTVIQYLEADMQPGTYGHRTHCLYSGTGPPAGTYVTRCPGANSVNSTTSEDEATFTERMYTMWAGLGHGTYHAGATLVRTQSPPDVLAVHVFVEYL